jgi:predicted DNA binding CopG/RHH family protein
MNEQQSQADVLATIRAEIAAERQAAEAESDPETRERRLESAGIRAEVAEEEAEAIAAEIAESKETALSLRIPESLSRELKRRASTEHIPVSALVRRLLTQAVHDPGVAVPTVDQVEEIARRVAREEINQA